MVKSRKSPFSGRFIEETEIHGLRKAFAGGNAFRRLMWLCLFLMSTAAMCYFLYRGFLEYASDRVSTETQIVVSDEIPFPAVTVCNINEIDLRKVRNKGYALLVYLTENCVSSCFRRYVREKLGCWLYDTEPDLVHAEEHAFDETDRLLLESPDFDLPEPGVTCPQIPTARALGLKAKLSDCAENCPLPCNYERFDIIHSSEKFDSEPYTLTKVDFNSSTTITVRQKRSIVTLVKQVEAYTLYNFVAEVGGSMGICIGASMLTLCHLIEHMVVRLALKVGAARRLLVRVSPTKVSAGAVDAVPPRAEMADTAETSLREAVERTTLASAGSEPASPIISGTNGRAGKANFSAGKQTSDDVDSNAAAVNSFVSPFPAISDIYI